jgi:hypothetical protein
LNTAHNLEISGPKRDKITGAWRKMHNENLNNSYSSPNTSIIRMIKSRRMKWAGHVACTREEACKQGFGRKTRRKDTTRKT